MVVTSGEVQLYHKLQGLRTPQTCNGGHSLARGLHFTSLGVPVTDSIDF